MLARPIASTSATAIQRKPPRAIAPPAAIATIVATSSSGAIGPSAVVSAGSECRTRNSAPLRPSSSTSATVVATSRRDGGVPPASRSSTCLRAARIGYCVLIAIADRPPLASLRLASASSPALP